MKPAVIVHPALSLYLGFEKFVAGLEDHGIRMIQQYGEEINYQQNIYVHPCAVGTPYITLLPVRTIDWDSLLSLVVREYNNRVLGFLM